MRINHSLQHLISILYMLMKILDPRIEDIRKAMLSKVAIGQYSIDLCKFILLVQPDVSQIGDGIQIDPQDLQGMEELLVVEFVFLEDSKSKILIFSNVSKNCLAIVLRDILRLARFGAFQILRFIFFGLIGILRVALVHSSSFAYFFIYLLCQFAPSLLPVVTKLGGIFSICGGVIFTILLALVSLGGGIILFLDDAGDELVVLEELLIQMIGEVEQFGAVLIEIVEVNPWRLIGSKNREI